MMRRTGQKQFKSGLFGSEYNIVSMCRFQLIVLLMTLIAPSLAAEMKTFYFNETFTCSTGNPNFVSVRVCEIDTFSDFDCTAWIDKSCGALCAVVVPWSDTEDEWPGTEFEFRIEFKHTCSGPNSFTFLYPLPDDDYIDIPIDGPAVRSFAYNFNLDTYPIPW